MEWLLDGNALDDLQSIAHSGFRPTAEDVAHVEAAAAEEIELADAPRNLSRDDGTAVIGINGFLTERPTVLGRVLGGGTSYRQIRYALAAAASDPDVQEVVLDINSPGGSVDGMFETIAAIEAFPTDKKLSAHVAKATSAAYALAAATGGQIHAKSPAASFGSIGAASVQRVAPEMVTIRNTDSPAKRPDPGTDEGRAHIVAHLDAINGLFTEAIANGRSAAGQNITAEQVRSDYGRGATLLAAEAIGLGMADSMPAKSKGRITAAQDSTHSAVLSANEPAEGGQEIATMDLNELKTAHSDLYAAILAEGKEAGIAEERDRVTAHLALGEESGDMVTACAAIESGDLMTQTLTAKYLAAGMRKAEQTARQTETEEAAQAAEGADATEEEETADEDTVAAENFDDEVLAHFRGEVAAE